MGFVVKLLYCESSNETILSIEQHNNVKAVNIITNEVVVLIRKKKPLVEVVSKR